MGIIVNDDSNPVGVHTFTLDVTKYNPNHGSNGQYASGGGGVGAGGGDSKSSPNQKKMESALDEAKNAGMSDSIISSIRDSHANRDKNELENLEAGTFEGAAGRHGVSVNEKGYTALHTATVHALRDLTGKGKADYPKISEMH